MTGTIAQTIQGEAGSNPANQFAVASTIFNRMKLGTFGGGTDPNAIVNAPNQYVGSATPNSSAQQFADAIQNGTLGLYGNTGNATYFQTAGSATTLGSNPDAVNIGGNNFSDQWGSPSAGFVPPSLSGAYSNNPNTSPADGGIVITAPSTFNPGASGAGTDPGFGASGSGSSASPAGSGSLGSGFGGASGSGSAGGSGSGSGLGGALGGIVGGLTGGTTGGGFFTGLLNDVESLFLRSGLILFGIVLVVIALWAMVGHSQAAQNVREAARSAGRAVAEDA